VIDHKKRVKPGIISGLGFAAFILCLAWVNSLIGDLRFIQIIVNFFVSTPIFLLKTQSTNNSIIHGILFFVYWGLVGGIVGFCIKTSFSKIAITLIIVAIVISHILIQSKIQRGLDSAMGSFGEAIGKIISGEATIKESKP
jgi:hypothetical protein